MADRTLSARDEAEFGKTRVSLLMEAQAAKRMWVGFSSDECGMLLEGGMAVQRVSRREAVLKTGEAATFFGVVLQVS